MGLGRAIWTLDDLQTVADGGLSPARRRGMGDAILARLGRPETPDALEWRGRSLLELGRLCLEARGVSLRNVGRMERAALALGLTRGGPHGFLATSDFPSILAQVGRTQLLAGYQAAPRTFPPWCRAGTLPDFRVTNKVSIGMGPRLLKVAEHAEYPRGPLPSTVAQAHLAKYGRVLSFTREALVNDDIGFFNEIPTFFGNAAAAMESDIVYGLLTSNPPMADGQPLFAAAHNNLMAAAPITIQSINAARQAMLNQTAPDGQFLSIMPRFLIVGPAQELAALQFLAPISLVGASQQVVPQTYRALQLIVEPRITDAAWYLAADPNQVDTIEYDYLAGAPGGGPTLETRSGWDIDGQEYKAREEFSATPIDYRGLVKNPGQLPA